jgi:GT2 family glycosyltransferase
MSFNPRVGIVVLNWNGWEDTSECLSSLRQITYENSEIFVVDNASTNNSVRELRNKFPDICIIESNTNRGFSGGNNLGIKHAKEQGCSHFWLLNNDTVVSPESLDDLVNKFLKDAQFGLLGSVIYEYYEPEKVQAWGGSSLSMPLSITKHYTKPVEDSKIGCILGASMFTSYDILEKVGYLDEKYFFFLEDTDLSLRVRLSGYKLGVATNSIVYHKGGSSIKSVDAHRNIKADVYYNTSLGYFMKKHKSGLFFASLRVSLMVINKIIKIEINRVSILLSAYIKGYNSK